jgi:hypothetical protein
MPPKKLGLQVNFLLIVNIQMFLKGLLFGVIGWSQGLLQQWYIPGKLDANQGYRGLPLKHQQ